MAKYIHICSMLAVARLIPALAQHDLQIWIYLAIIEFQEVAHQGGQPNQSLA
jgi:hypothetical protein